MITEKEDSPLQKKSYKIKEIINKIKIWFIRLCFKQKLLYTFTISTLITLVVITIVMYSLLQSINQSDIKIIDNDDNDFNSFSTLYVSQGISKIALTGFDRFSQLLFQLAQTYAYFSIRPQIYTSLTGSSPKPEDLTSFFTAPNPLTSAIFLYGSNSTFQNDPYMDQVLSILGYYRYPAIKRINIFYYNTSNPLDLMARTTPATNDFIIVKPQDIYERINNLVVGYYTIGSVYADKLSKTSQTLLVSIRTLIIPEAHPELRILIEIQILQAGIQIIFKNLFYFPSTNVLALQVIKPNKYKIINSLKPINFDLTPFLDVGVKKVELQNGTTVIAGTASFAESQQLNKFARVSRSNDEKYRFIVLTNHEQSRKSSHFMETFVSNSHESILIILCVWSVFFLVFCIFEAIVVGNHFFYYLHFLTEKMKSYLKTPANFGVIKNQIELIDAADTIGLIMKSYVEIMSKIQTRKKQAVQKSQPKQKFPLNICSREFQIRTGLNDYKIMDTVYQQLLEKQKLKNK